MKNLLPRIQQENVIRVGPHGVFENTLSSGTGLEAICYFIAKIDSASQNTEKGYENVHGQQSLKLRLSLRVGRGSRSINDAWAHIDTSTFRLSLFGFDTSYMDKVY